MDICFFLFRIDSLTYTITKALAQGHHNIFLYIIQSENNPQSDQQLRQYLNNNPQVTFLSQLPDTWPHHFDRLIIQSHTNLLSSRSTLPALVKRSSQLTLISAGDRKQKFTQAIKTQILEANWLRPWRKKITHVAYKDGFFSLDYFLLHHPRTAIGFDIHSQFLENHEAFQNIHSLDWKIDPPRNILANFLGSRDPHSRGRILNEIRPLMAPNGNGNSKAGNDKTWYWHEYSDSSPGGLSRQEFLNILSHSDFTLCPLGYSLITHRPIEALLRGSIPVLNSNELDLYAIDLKDGINCIAVPQGNWRATIETLMTINEETISNMRKTIYGMAKSLLDYSTSSRNMRNRLGVDS